MGTAGRPTTSGGGGDATPVGGCNRYISPGRLWSDASGTPPHVPSAQCLRLCACPGPLVWCFRLSCPIVPRPLAHAPPPATVPAPRPVLGTLAFPTVDEGWAAAAAGPGPNAQGLLLHTTDGGRTWQTQLHSVQPVHSVAFVSAAEGWASVGSSVYRTRDGGQGWAAIFAAKTPLLSLAFPTALQGWAIATDEPTSRGFGPAATLEHTADGARTWAAAPAACPASRLGSADDGRGARAL